METEKNMRNTLAIRWTQACGAIEPFTLTESDTGAMEFLILMKIFPHTIAHAVTTQSHHLCLLVPLSWLDCRCTSLHPLQMCIDACQFSMILLWMRACPQWRQIFAIISNSESKSSFFCCCCVQCARKWKIMCRINLTEFRSGERKNGYYIERGVVTGC